MPTSDLPLPSWVRHPWLSAQLALFGVETGGDGDQEADSPSGSLHMLAEASGGVWLVPETNFTLGATAGLGSRGPGHKRGAVSGLGKPRLLGTCGPLIPS